MATRIRNEIVGEKDTRIPLEILTTTEDMSNDDIAMLGVLVLFDRKDETS